MTTIVSLPRLVVLLQFLAMLSGCSAGGTTFTSEVDSDAETLSSRVRVQDGVSRFDCRASSSGQCYYTLYPHACNGEADCKLAPLRHFAVARGDSRQIAGLSDFRPCGSARDVRVGADCQPAASVAR